MNDRFDNLPTQFDTLRRRAIPVAAIAVLLGVLGLFLDAKQFFLSYLLAYVFWMNFSLGCLALLMLHHLVSGRWGFLIQRLLEAGARTIPLMAILFLPVILGLTTLYPWAGTPEQMSSESILHLHHKAAYLTIPFFIVRSAIYFGLWIGAALLLTRWSREQDRTADPSRTRSLRALSAPGLIVYVLTVSLASVDWVMSLEPEWFSSIYGILFVVSQGLSALALCIILIALLRETRPVADAIETKHFHHLGNLLLAFVVLWAYIAFSQLLIIWSGNLPEEITWYLRRIGPSWQAVALLLVIFHFAVPFFVLLVRRTKKSARYLSMVGAGIIVMRFVDVFWLIVPAVHTDGLHVHWLDVVLPVAIGGIWLSVFVAQLRSQPILPLHDPRFEIVSEHA
jgi:hypothetical protein